MTHRENDEPQSTGRRVRHTPATIRERVEADPVDVALGAEPTPATAAGRDTTPGGDTRDTGGDTTSRQTSAAATPGGDSDRATRHRQRHGDTATGDSDTIRDSDTTSRRQATATPGGVATSPDAATGDSDTRYGDTGDTATAAGEGDMTATATPTPLGAPRRGRSKKAAQTQKDAPAGGEIEMEAVRSTSFSMPPSLISRLRAAQWHTQLQPDGYLNVSELVRSVVQAEIERLEAAYNGGRPFPKVDRLRTGPSPRGAVRGAQIRAKNREGAAERARAEEEDT